MTDPLRSKLIRLAYAQPSLREHLLPLITPMPAVYGPPDASSRNAPTGPWYPTPYLPEYVYVDRLEWKPAAEEARTTTQHALPPCRCMGPDATIKDEGQGPILNLEYGHDLDPGKLDLMAQAVSALGWREWARTARGIAFKPTWVKLD